MQIRVLGPLEVRIDGGETVTIGGARLRMLLIILALESTRVVSTTRLVDGIWGDEPPAGAVNAVQALVSRLRRALPQARIESYPAGYRLVIESDAVDAARFERLVAAGREQLSDDPASAARMLGEALNLWRGPVLLDVAEAGYFAAPVARLSELRLAALEDRVDADLRLGRAVELITELTSLVAEHPLRESLIGALMRALSLAGRRAEALAVYERARQALAEALGTDPSAELSALHTALLRGEVSSVSTGESWPRTNLRAGLTSFVGRDSDLTRIGKLVREYRLTTLTGPGGSGKTRLAVEMARTLQDHQPDGVWLVELAPLVAEADLPSAVLAALGLREQALADPGPAAGPVDRLAVTLRTRSALLVLDNCEHLIRGVAALAERLLGECPRLRILATSREPLGITGEVLWSVEPLALPPPDAGVADALSYSAVRLLVDRAGAARPRFAVTESTVPAVVRICQALDGMPLAIELAAARLRTMPPEQLAGRLDERFRLLTGGAADCAAPASDAAGGGRLELGHAQRGGAFAGAQGAELVAAALAVPGPVDDEVLALAYAVSVLFATTGLGDEREIAGMLDKAHRLAARTGWRHPMLRFLKPLADFVRSAQDATVAPPDVMDGMLADDDPWIRAQARLNRARMTLNYGRERTGAEADIRTGLSEFREIGERWGIAFSLTTLADLVALRGDVAAAHGYNEGAVAVVSEIGTVEDLVHMRIRQAQLSWLLGDPAGAAAAMAQAERDAARSGWPDAVAALALAKAESARWSGDLDTATAQLARTEEVIRHLVVHPVFRAMVRDSMGYVEALGGDLEAACAHRAQALALAVESRHAPTVAQVLVGLADQATRCARPEEAAGLLAASVAVRGAPDLSNRDAARIETATRAAVGERAFADATRAGQDATIDTAHEIAAVTLDRG